MTYAGGEKRGRLERYETSTRAPAYHAMVLLWLQIIITHDVICVAWNSGIQGVQLESRSKAMLFSKVWISLEREI